MRVTRAQTENTKIKTARPSAKHAQRGITTERMERSMTTTETLLIKSSGRHHKQWRRAESTTCAMMATRVTIITEITGITDDDFNNSDDNISIFKKDIERIFKLCDMPIFIAHNGNRFDHEILVNKNIINKYNCILLDSREIISVSHNKRNLYNKKLGEIYENIMGYKKENIHRAKEDTDMIIEIFNKINITSDKILTFIKSIK